MTAVGRMHERFSLVERIISVPVTAYLTFFVEKMDTKENHKKKFKDLTVWGSGKTHMG